MAGIIKSLNIDLKASFDATDPVVEQLTEKLKSVGIHFGCAGSQNVTVQILRKDDQGSEIVRLSDGVRTLIEMRSERYSFFLTSVSGSRRREFSYLSDGSVCRYRGSRLDQLVDETPAGRAEGHQMREDRLRAAKEVGSLIINAF